MMPKRKTRLIPKRKIRFRKASREIKTRCWFFIDHDEGRDPRIQRCDLFVAHAGILDQEIKHLHEEVYRVTKYPPTNPGESNYWSVEDGWIGYFLLKDSEGTEPEDIP